MDEAITKILQSECEAEVHRLAPEELLKGTENNSIPSFSLSLVNHQASNDKSEAVLQHLKEDKRTGSTVVLHAYPDDNIPGPLLETGADHYISIKSEVSDFLDLINEVSESDSG